MKTQTPPDTPHSTPLYIDAELKSRWPLTLHISHYNGQRGQYPHLCQEVERELGEIDASDNPISLVLIIDTNHMTIPMMRETSLSIVRAG